MNNIPSECIPYNELSIGEYYQDSSGRCFYYFGKCKVLDEYRTKNNVRLCSYFGCVYVYVKCFKDKNEQIYFTYDLTYSPRIIVKKIKPEIDYNIDMNNLVFDKQDHGTCFKIRF